ncbi:hypothetical protein ACFQZI_00095 [Mucilaginibacter lutimaris]|uniref:DUF2116 family Zn-ribbon domain-containing protein n=1 Tax=Mucilaginibacter lutimaris TaxID=931629 RepID=A0ABW2Z9R4_9SPHI
MNEDTPSEPVKTCLECGQPLGPGRRDRRYCNDICRTAYNNRKRFDSTVTIMPLEEPSAEQKAIDRDMLAIQRVYNILLQNRIKLYNLFNLFERAVPIEDFNRCGINLNYFTSVHTDDYYEKPFKMCFDYGYHIDGNTVYLTYHGNEIFIN